MRITFFAKDALNLYNILVSSETSRNALKFYHPIDESYGISLVTGSLGSSLALLGELRWYIRRYVEEAVLQISPDIHCTPLLAQRFLFDKDISVQPDWPMRKAYVIEGQKITKRLTLNPRENPPSPGEGTLIFEVWCTEEEFL